MPASRAPERQDRHEIPLSAQLDLLIAHAPFGFAIVDRDLRFVRINEALAEINGLPVDAHLGRTLAQVLPDLSATLEPLYRRVLVLGERIDDIEILGRTPARPEIDRTWIASYYPVRDELDAVIGVGVLVREVTDQRRLAADRTAAAELLAHVLERVADGFVALDCDWRYTYVNQKAGEFFGRDPADLVGRHIWTEFPDGVGQPFHLAYERAMETQTPITFEDYYEPWDRWFENRVYPSADGLSIFFTEVTERRRAERAQERDRQRIAAIHQLEASIVRAEDPTRVVASALRAVRTVLGSAHAALYQVDAPAAMRTMLALEGDDVVPANAIGRRGPLPEPVAEAFGRGEPVVLADIRPLAAGDPSFAYAVSAGTVAMLILPLPGPAPLLLIADWQEVHPAEEGELEVLREIGDTLAIAFRQADLFAQVAAHAEELEARVEERTRQLTEINTELDAFSYTVSHDLRAPLRAMQGFAAAIVEDEGDRLSPIGQELAERIVLAGDRMELLIADLLEYSRVSRVTFRPEVVDLDTAAGHAIHQVEAAVAASAAEVIIDAPLGRVMGHPASVTQALANLLANAAKFTRAGTPPIVRVTGERRGDRIRLTVADNGIGIAPDHQERIFRVFERLHGQETYAGTGIGLAIVRKAVERMGGTVGVESTPGEGSRFWLDLRAAAATGGATE